MAQTPDIQENDTRQEDINAAMQDLARSETPGAEEAPTAAGILPLAEMGIILGGGLSVPFQGVSQAVGTGLGGILALRAYQKYDILKRMLRHPLLAITAGGLAGSMVAKKLRRGVHKAV